MPGSFIHSMSCRTVTIVKTVIRSTEPRHVSSHTNCTQSHKWCVQSIDCVYVGATGEPSSQRGCKWGIRQHLKADEGSLAVGKANWLVFFNPGRGGFFFFFLKQSRNITIIQPIAFLQGSWRLSWGLLFLLFQNPLKVIFLSIECSYFIFQRSPVPVEGLK